MNYVKWEWLFKRILSTGKEERLALPDGDGERIGACSAACIRLNQSGGMQAGRVW
jgi:hypothetical protein